MRQQRKEFYRNPHEHRNIVTLRTPRTFTPQLVVVRVGLR